ncbi:MAG TPA: D-alanyl-D-alanine carboxypeptidase family protein [Pyrinomonadaceae bacterium]|nr:D-alanyl-D-alanine carboxypeptidase family protein [Pyrinomonadaceae bacterium]
MKSRRVHLLILLLVFFALATFTLFTARTSSGQATRQKSGPATSPATRATSRITPNANAAFATAATQNAALRNELTWTFGGKQQRGWYIYDLLIHKTLDTEHDPDSTGFAAALATWQKRSGLEANGVLDENSLMRLISKWQSDRLKTRGVVDPSQLITASPVDFYDPSRAPELRQVERNTYAAYKEMLAAAIADPSLKLAHTSGNELAAKESYFKIVSAYRSPDYQDELRRKSPNSGSAGLAVNSPHFTGRALDLYVGGDPVDTKDANRAIQVNTPAYRWLVRNAERFGFRPYFYEPWHWEYVK